LSATSASHPGTRVTATPAAASARSTAASTAGSAPPAAAGTVTRPAISSPAPSGTRKPGSSRRIPSSSAAMSGPIGPTVSRDGASGYTPLTGTRPYLVLSPATPQQAAGTRTEPPVSVPKATSASPGDAPPAAPDTGGSAISATTGQPAVVGSPAMSMQSFTASRGPASSPSA